MKTSTTGYTLNTGGKFSDSMGEHDVKDEVIGSAIKRTRHSVDVNELDASQSQVHLLTDDSAIPLPPPLELETGSQVEISDIQKNLLHFYNYNIILWEKTSGYPVIASFFSFKITIFLIRESHLTCLKLKSS